MKIRGNTILIIVFMLMFAVLFFRLAQLQLLEGKRYQKMALENAAKIVPDFAPRGKIYDRNGKVLATSRPSFSIQILPYLLPKDLASREAVIKRLSRIMGEKIELKFSAQQPVIVKNNVQLEKAIQIEEQERELPGVVVNTQPIRFYPYGSVASHVLGYVGEIESKELSNLKNVGYRLGDIVGKDGVEKLYDRWIRGIDGGKIIEVDVYGNPTRLIKSLDPVPGADMKLTIDIELQEAVEKALAGKVGAVVVLDPKTGEILALASHPNYDPNNVSRALMKGRYPFIDRALAIYPPGSIFKVVTLTAALEEKVASPDEIIYCPGYYRVNNRIAKCWKEVGHGRITVEEGLVQSCDVVFYELGRRLGPERLAKYARDYGLGVKTGIDLPQEKRGLVPSESWKRENLKEPWYEGDSINYGIGQGFLQVTPLQMAVLYGSLATGKRMRPFVVAEVKKSSGEILYQAKTEEVGSIPISKQNLVIIQRALGEVVSRGTGIAAKLEMIPAAGKTGTAQNPGLPHAWFICYAPKDNPKIAIASFVEHGEHGDRSAAYVARDILTWYQKNRLKNDFDNVE